jgi:peptidyl-prolyl cis-trans isomerase A (cyclophilin A)
MIGGPTTPGAVGPPSWRRHENAQMPGRHEYNVEVLALTGNLRRSHMCRSSRTILLALLVLVSLPVFTLAMQQANLKNPAALKEQAPATFKALFETSAGNFVVEVHRDWAPKGADRFYNLVKNGFFDNCRFFRVVPNFMVQFGINGDPTVQSAWRNANITDDLVKEGNRRSYITFATAGPNSRTTQVFINFRDNGGLDGQGFAPFGRVVTGMDVVDKLYGGYGENPPETQGRLQAEGNAYLAKAFPKLDSIKKATIQQ